MDFQPHTERRLTIALGSPDEFKLTARAVKAEAHAAAIQERRDDTSDNKSRRLFTIAETLGAAAASIGTEGVMHRAVFDADEVADISMSAANAADEVARREALYITDDSAIGERHVSFKGLSREWADAAAVAIERYEGR